MITYRQPFAGDYGISQKFGETTTNPNGHTGIDYLCPLGTNILASADGTVIYAGWDKTGYGNLVCIRHADLNLTMYAHLSLISVIVGESVRQGQKIGESGTTGNSTGPHLHFEIRGSDGRQFDPMSVLHSATDVSPHTERPSLKGAENFKFGDLVRIQNLIGAYGYYSTAFESRTRYPQHTPFIYAGETAVNPKNGLTYMKVIPASFSVWVAVHDEDTQILDT